jgi:peptidyl-prolyl cis-trans isomerase C
MTNTRSFPAKPLAAVLLHFFTSVIPQAQAQAPSPPTDAAAPAATTSNSLLSQPFVTVNGQVRNNAQAELLLREQLQTGAPNSPQMQVAVRELMINQSLMAQAAQKVGLDKLPLVQAQVELARHNTLAQAWQETVLRDIQLTDADLNAEYKRQVAALGPEEFQLRHLLVAEEAIAKQLIDRIKAGTPIADLAAEFSRDEATRGQGGLSGWAPQGELLPGLLEAVRNLPKGQRLEQPVLTPRGWHVVQLEDRRAYQAPPLERVRPQLAQAIGQQRIQKRLEELRQTAKVE